MLIEFKRENKAVIVIVIAHITNFWIEENDPAILYIKVAGETDPFEVTCDAKKEYDFIKREIENPWIYTREIHYPY